MSAPSAIPPIAPTPLPGAGPKAPLGTIPVVCDQASTSKLADLGIVELDCEDSLWHTSTLVSSKSAHRRHADIILFERDQLVINTFRSSEISFAPLTAQLLKTYSRNTHNCDHINDFSLKSVQGSDLEIRSLTPLSNAHNIISTMSTTVTSVPGSPPDLSASRSSKSSSYSSTFSSPDGLEADIINFEEIGLEDDKHATPRFCHSRDVSTQSVGSQHELIKTKDSGSGERKPTLPQIQTQVSVPGPRHDSAPPRIAGSRLAAFKRGFTTPETFYSMLAVFNLFPNHRQTLWECKAGGPHGSLTEKVSKNWRQNIMIPMMSSLRMQVYGTSLSLLMLQDKDHTVPASAEARKGINQLRVHDPYLLNTPEQLQKAPPRSFSLTPATSNPSSPRKSGHTLNGRTKSWNIAMADLSEEARIISEALEYHAEAKEQERLERVRGGSSRGSPETSMDRGSRSSSIQLPPIQKSALDFMPISREKEAILSRTRPSWLPPKDPKEERRHLREYQRMMAASIEAEKKRRTKLQVQQCEKDDTRESLNRIWHYYIDETTDITTIDKRVNDLCWRGVSPNLRGKVWQRAVGNSLGLTVQSYEKALQRAKEIKNRSGGRLDRDEKSMERWFVDIERDAETAFPELNLFQRHGPLWQDLIDVCEAYACYRSDVGYIYGIQLIAALLLLQLSTPTDAFILLANCLNRAVPLAFQTDDTTITNRTYNHAVSTLGIKFPRLYEYLFGSVEQGGLGFRGEEVFEPMLRTIFSNGLDVDRLCRIWDIWIFEGDRTLVNAAVAILGSLQQQLYDVQGDTDLKRRNIQEMLGWGPFNRLPQSGHWNLQLMGDEDKFVEEVRLAGMLDYTGK
ncbi:hypothetical protein AYO22_10539 [Fonsecaea multimorphosa]|nr:hypothetical protein AYO22_10539 [Fonsecaea multimorphosa]